MKVEIPYHHGQPVYLKNDPEQSEYLINRIILAPGKVIYLEISDCFGALMEVCELLVTTELDALKKLK